MTKTIDLAKVFDLVNHTKLLRALFLLYLNNNTKRWLVQMANSQLPIQLTLSPSFNAWVRVPQGACLSPTLFNIFSSPFPQSDNYLTSSYADDFTIISCFNSYVYQMAEALSAHSPIIEEWTDVRGLAISAPKSTITIHPSICAIYHPSSSHSEQLHTTSGKEPLYTGSDLRSSL